MICTFSPRSKNSSAGIPVRAIRFHSPFWLPLKEKENDVFQHADMSLRLLRHECGRSFLYFTRFSFLEGVKHQQVCDITKGPDDSLALVSMPETECFRFPEGKVEGPTKHQF